MKKKRKALPLPSSLTSKLGAYAAAGAAGLGTSFDSADAAICYIDLGDASLEDIIGDQQLTVLPVNMNPTSVAGSALGDTVNDLAFMHYRINGSSGVLVVNGAYAPTSAAPSNGFLGFVASNYFYPSNLGAGANIGPTDSFQSLSRRGDMGFYAGFPSSQWTGGVSDGYLGVRFIIDGNAHYGWIRLSVTDGAAAGYSATIHDLAFETEPDTAIAAGDDGGSVSHIPEPGSLGLLALGGSGLLLWRRRRQAAASEALEEEAAGASS